MPPITSRPLASKSQSEHRDSGQVRVKREEQIGHATPVYVIAEALSALFN